MTCPHHWLLAETSNSSFGACTRCGDQREFSGGVDWVGYGMQPFMGENSRPFNKSDIRNRGVAVKRA